MLFRSQKIKQHKSVVVLIVCHFLSSLLWRGKWRVSWFNDFIRRFYQETKPRSQKLTNIIDRLTPALRAACAYGLTVWRLHVCTLLYSILFLVVSETSVCACACLEQRVFVHGLCVDAEPSFCSVRQKHAHLHAAHRRYGDIRRSATGEHWTRRTAPSCSRCVNKCAVDLRLFARM